MNMYSKSKGDIINQLLCALEITSMGIWEWNLKNNYMELSDEVFKITGFEKEDFDGTMDYVLNEMIHKDFKERFKLAIDSVRENGNISNGFYRIANPKKDSCWIKVYSRMIYDENGNPEKVMGTILDITDEHSNNEYLSSSLKFLQSLMDTLPNPVFYKDTAGVFRFCNRTFLEFLGKKSDEIIGLSVYDIAPKELADVYNDSDMTIMRTKGRQVYESRLQYMDGTFHDVIFSKGAHLDENGNVIGLVGIAQDITEKKRLEKELKMLYGVKDIFLEINKNIVNFSNKIEFFDEIQLSLRKVFIQCTNSSVLKVCDDGYLRILTAIGYSESQAEAFAVKFSESFIYKDSGGDFSKSHIINHIDKFEKESNEKVILTESGESIKSSLAIPIYIEEKLKWIICLDSTKDNVYSDIDILMADYISEELPIIWNLYDLNLKTLYFSRYDGLTGVMNRRYFEGMFEEYLKQEVSEEQILYVLFDLDGLKKVNDAYGHLAGDLYIKEFVSFVSRNIKDAKLFGRIGGDEFALTIIDYGEEKLIEDLEALRREFFKLSIKFEDQIFSGNFSYGISAFPREGNNMSQIMKIADINMYKDKNRNRR